MSLPTLSREKIRVRAADFLYYLFSFIFFLVGVLMYTYPSIQGVQQFYREQALVAEKMGLREVRNWMVLEYERLMSPYAMRARASSIGFIRSEADNAVYIRRMR